MNQSGSSPAAKEKDDKEVEQEQQHPIDRLVLPPTPKSTLDINAVRPAPPESGDIIKMCMDTFVKLSGHTARKTLVLLNKDTYDRYAPKLYSKIKLDSNSIPAIKRQVTATHIPEHQQLLTSSASTSSRQTNERERIRKLYSYVITLDLEDYLAARTLSNLVEWFASSPLLVNLEKLIIGHNVIDTIWLRCKLIGSFIDDGLIIKMLTVRLSPKHVCIDIFQKTLDPEHLPTIIDFVDLVSEYWPLESVTWHRVCDGLSFCNNAPDQVWYLHVKDEERRCTPETILQLPRTQEEDEYRTAYVMNVYPNMFVTVEDDDEPISIYDEKEPIVTVPFQASKGEWCFWRKDKGDECYCCGKQ